MLQHVQVLSTAIARIAAGAKKSRLGSAPKKALARVGLLVNGPPGTAGLPFII
jgi:hypothetical protein